MPFEMCHLPTPICLPGRFTLDDIKFMLPFLQKLAGFRAYKTHLFCCRIQAENGLGEEVSRTQENNSAIQRLQKVTPCLIKVDSSMLCLWTKDL